MKVSVDDFMASHRKTGLKSFVEKKIANDSILAKDPSKEDKEKGTAKTFVLSPTGGEIHRGESVVDRISKPETLREKIARFERLSQKVRENRLLQLQMLQESIGDGKDEDVDDFDFDDGEFVDDFGDVVKPKPVQPVKPVESGEDDGEKSPAPQSQGDVKPSDEPDENPA